MNGVATNGSGAPPDLQGFLDAAAEAQTAPTPQPSADDPLRGLEHLSKVALFGRDKILEAASKLPIYIWDDVTEAGTINLLAAAPGGGKTTLLFLLIAARLNTGAAVTVLDRTVTPAPLGKYVVVIEAEHQEGSASRMLVKALGLLGIDDEALHRVVLVARQAVRVGSPEWEDVERMIAVGIVSDVVLDTLARVAPSDANNEQEQVQVFERIAQAIGLAPKNDAPPTVRHPSSISASSLVHSVARADLGRLPFASA
jgi:AAA domain